MMAIERNPDARMVTLSEYKTTLFDRHGPDAYIYLRAFGLSITVFATTALACTLRGAPLALTLVLSFAFGGFALWGTLRINRGVDRAARFLTQGGSSTPYEEQYSQEQALVMQRDYAGALALFEQRIASAPLDARVRIAAADLYVQHGDNPRRAAELYKQVQSIPRLPIGQDVYVANRLADLYLGPLQQPGKALVELRRLVDRHPNSPAAAHARAAIANLKSEVVGSDGSTLPYGRSPGRSG